MESYSVCQLQRDMRFEGFLLVRSAERRKDVKGNDYVDMNLTDRTGEINCKIWNWDSSAEMPEAGSTVKLRGTVQEYNGRLQLRVEKWRMSTPEDEVDMNQLVPCAPRKPEDMMAEIRETVTLLEHMLLSHHGESEYGSPKAPMFPEAEALHWLDMTDARMNTFRTAADKTPEGAFSEKIFSLDRRIYHPRYTEDAE